jgi:signal transduction histidine kinase
MVKELLRILMLEDLEEDAGLVDRALHKGDLKFERIRVDTAESFIQALDEFKPDIILSDHSLPQFNSIEALNICQQKNIDAPFILVTGAVSEEFAVNCLKMGATDYVLKSNLSRLNQAIKHALQKHNAEKDKLNQEETLRKKNEELIKINKELDTFMYRVSHDLRSPLSSILGLVGVARMDGNKAEEMAQRYFEMIERNVLRLDETLREILDYYKNARVELVVEEIDFMKIIDAVFELSKPLKGFEEIVTKVNVQQQPSLHSDSYRLSVILTNLVSNSIKYRDEKKVKQIINISIEVSEEQAVLEIEDNGIGIQEEYLPFLFNMFYRATEKSQGAGLGLYVVKEMVGKLNGRIDVSSEHGSGTTIKIFVPNRK